MLASSMERRPHIILMVKCLPILVFQAMVRPAATLPRALRACCVHEHCPLPAGIRLDDHSTFAPHAHVRFLACSPDRICVHSAANAPHFEGKARATELAVLILRGRAERRA